MCSFQNNASIVYSTNSSRKISPCNGCEPLRVQRVLVSMTSSNCTGVAVVIFYHQRSYSGVHSTITVFTVFEYTNSSNFSRISQPQLLQLGDNLTNPYEEKINALIGALDFHLANVERSETNAEALHPSNHVHQRAVGQRFLPARDQ